MKLLVTGVRGQLGHDIVFECKKRGIDVVGVDVEEMDITDFEAVKSVISDAHPDAVVHCAAYTAVDKAQDDEETCRRVNVDGTRNIAEICNVLNIKMMYFSTDYVFDGSGECEWVEDDPKAPLSVYGQSKYDGELVVEAQVQKHFILRISWVFGTNGANFVKTMLRLGSERGTVSVVNDQIGSPTYTPDLARLVVDMIQTDKYGVYHVSNEGICSWYEFACEIFRQAGMTEVTVIPVDSSVFPAKAKRPHNSRLSKKRLQAVGFTLLPTWQDALGRFLGDNGFTQ